MSAWENGRAYIGDTAQLFAVREYRLCGGKAEGLRAVDIDNGSGLCVTVLLDRCMDIGRVTFHGQNVTYLTGTGPVAPTFVDRRGDGWLRAFGGGLMTTCGFENIGAACTDGGEALPMHGTLSATPAQDVSVTVEHTADGPEACIRGTVRDVTLFGNRLVLERTIRCRYGDNRIRVSDRVQNVGAAEVPLMMMYHCNFGYPLLDEQAQIVIASDAVTPRDAEAAQGLSAWRQMPPPTDGYREQCFYHTLKTALCGVYQPKSEIGVFLRWESDTLDRMVQWKMAGTDAYVLGLEPANATIGGRDAARADGSLKYLKAGESVQTALTFTFTYGEAAAQPYKAEAEE